MSTVIHKHSFNLSDLTNQQKIQLPIGARFLSAVNQRGALCLYEQHDTKITEIHDCYIHVIGTGHEHDLPTAAVFVGTVMFDGGELMLHIFSSEGV